MLTEIIRSCSHAFVAEAAIRSIGGHFAEGVRNVANSRGLSPGAYAAKVVRKFDRSASQAARQALRVAIRRADQPVLVGLRFILDRAIEEDDTETTDHLGGRAFRNEMSCYAWH